MTDQYLSILLRFPTQYIFNFYTCVIMYYLFIRCYESRLLRVGGLGFCEVAVSFYEMAVGVLLKIRHSQNYDNYIL